MKKIFVAMLIVLSCVTPALAVQDNATVYLAFVFYADGPQKKTIVVGGSSMSECQEVFKAFLTGVGGDVQDFTVAACRSYSLSNLPQS